MFTASKFFSKASSAISQLHLYTDETTVRVRYGETDQMGVVYYGNYAVFLEVGRVEWLRKLGISYSEMEGEGILLPVVSMNIQFKKSAHYDDVLTIRTTLSKKPSVKIAFDYEIYNSVGECLVTAHTILVFIDKQSKKPISCPGYLLEKLDEIK